MKPDWKDAPEWAHYLAQDMDGTWYWYQLEPRPCYHFNMWILKLVGGVTRYVFAYRGDFNLDFYTTLEKRQ